MGFPIKWQARMTCIVCFTNANNQPNTLQMSHYICIWLLQHYFNWSFSWNQIILADCRLFWRRQISWYDFHSWWKAIRSIACSLPSFIQKLASFHGIKCPLFLCTSKNTTGLKKGDYMKLHFLFLSGFVASEVLAWEIRQKGTVADFFMSGKHRYRKKTFYVAT